MGIGFNQLRWIQIKVIRKVGWPCPMRAYGMPAHALKMSGLQESILAWVRSEWASGRQPTDSRIGEKFGISKQRAAQLRRIIMRRSGWPFSLQKKRSGSYGLTGTGKRILAVAIELWEAGEYPSIWEIHRSMQPGPPSHRTIEKCRRECVHKKIWPCKVKSERVALDGDRVNFILDYRRSGKLMGRFYHNLISEYRNRFKVSLHPTTVYRVLRRNGLAVARVGSSGCDSLDVRKRMVLDSRGDGFVIPDRDAPAALRKAMRAGKARQNRCSSRVEQANGVAGG